jgi:hypothetical protein
MRSSGPELDDPPPIDWLIVGGGPHGFHLAVRLLAAGVDPNTARILDPHPGPLERWRSYTGNTGMFHLRSPQVHNLGTEPLALESLANSHGFRAIRRDAREPEFIPPYERPSLALFEHHARRLVEEWGLARLWIRGRAVSLDRGRVGYRVALATGNRLQARNVVLALGSGDHLHRPDWARGFDPGDPSAPLHHVFDPGFRRDALDPSEDVVVVGAGNSAAQLALALARANPDRRITLLSPHSLRQADFESDPGWLGPLRLTEFDAESCPVRRRSMIDEARQRGTLATDVMQALTGALRAGSITHTLAHVESARRESPGNRVELTVRPLELDEETYHRTGEIVARPSDAPVPLVANRVVLGTGFELGRPGGELVDRAIDALKLPLAPDGFPVLDRHLRWCPGLFATGPLAELMVGPASRNLSGARMAALRILESPELERSLAACTGAGSSRS